MRNLIKINEVIMENTLKNQAYESLFKAIAEIREIGIEANVKREFKNKCRGIEDVLNVVSDVFLKHKIWYDLLESEVQIYNENIFIFKGRFAFVHESGDRTSIEEFIGQGDASAYKAKGAVHAQTEAIKSFLLAKCGFSKTATEEMSTNNHSKFGTQNYKSKAPDFTQAYALLNQFRIDVKDNCINTDEVKNLWKQKYASRSQSLDKPDNYSDTLLSIINCFENNVAENRAAG